MKQKYRNPEEYLKAYRALAKEQADIWRSQEGDLTGRILEVQKRQLDLILTAPTILTTPEQKTEEEYLRGNMLDSREEMLRIRMSERYSQKGKLEESSFLRKKKQKI